jgi:hypothetical protein
MTYTENQLMILAATFFAVFVIAAIGAHLALVTRGKRHD